MFNGECYGISDIEIMKGKGSEESSLDGYIKLYFNIYANSIATYENLMNGYFDYEVPINIFAQTKTKLSITKATSRLWRNK